MSTTPLQQSFKLFSDVTDDVINSYKHFLRHNFDDDTPQTSLSPYIGYVLLCQSQHLSPDQPNDISDEQKFGYPDPFDPDDPEDDNSKDFLEFIDQSYQGQRVYQVPKPLFDSYDQQVNETTGTNWLSWAGPNPIYYDQDTESYFVVLPELNPANFKATLNQALFAGNPYSTKAIDTLLPELDA